MTRRRRSAGRDLRSRWYDRIRQSVADRRRGGRLPRTLRRLLAIALVLAAGVIALSPTASTIGEPVLTFSADLPIGARLQPQDLEIVPTARLPDGALREPAQAIGRELAGPARRGEVVTNVRLTDPAGPDPGPGRVAVPVRPSDPAIVDLLGPGMHVAVVTVNEAGTAAVLVSDAVVLVVPDRPDRGSTDRPIVLAVPAPSADQLVIATLAGTVALRFT